MLITTVGEGQSTTKFTARPECDPPSVISQLDGENEEDDHSAKSNRAILEFLMNDMKEEGEKKKQDEERRQEERKEDAKRMEKFCDDIIKKVKSA